MGPLSELAFRRHWLPEYCSCFKDIEDFNVIVVVRWAFHCLPPYLFEHRSGIRILRIFREGGYDKERAEGKKLYSVNVPLFLFPQEKCFGLF